MTILSSSIHCLANSKPSLILTGLVLLRKRWDVMAAYLARRQGKRRRRQRLREKFERRNKRKIWLFLKERAARSRFLAARAIAHIPSPASVSMASAHYNANLCKRVIQSWWCAAAVLHHEVLLLRERRRARRTPIQGDTTAPNSIALSTRQEEDSDEVWLVLSPGFGWPGRSIDGVFNPIWY